MNRKIFSVKCFILYRQRTSCRWRDGPLGEVYELKGIFVHAVDIHQKKNVLPYWFESLFPGKKTVTPRTGPSNVNPKLISWRSTPPVIRVGNLLLEIGTENLRISVVLLLKKKQQHNYSWSPLHWKCLSMFSKFKSSSTSTLLLEYLKYVFINFNLVQS